MSELVYLFDAFKAFVIVMGFMWGGLYLFARFMQTDEDWDRD